MRICVKCEKSKRDSEFYVSYSPLHNGKIPVCKSCIREQVNIDDINSVTDTLRMIDRPFLQFLWDASVEEGKETSTDIFGKYMKNIGMKQYKELTWADSDFEESKIINNDSLGQIDNKPDENKKIYSKKWMGYYTPTELDYLEKYLTGLHNDFKIVTENHKDYAKKIVKASFYMDKCFQDMQNGVNGAEKKYKDAKEVFDTLSKSAQFSESQRGQNDVGLGCFGKVFEMVESKTYIPEHIPIEKDDIDKLIDDFGHILKSI